MSKVLPFYSDTFVISESRLQYNQINQFFRSYALNFSHDFADRMYTEFKNLDDFIHRGYEFGLKYILLTCQETAFKLINENSIYDVSAESLFQHYYQSPYYTWDDAFGVLLDEYVEIVLDEEQKRSYRSLRKDLRGRFIGGGFGFEGAAKGMLAAGTLNVTSDILHGLFNGIGNFFTSMATDRGKQKLYRSENTKRMLKNALFQSVFNLQYPYIHFIEEHTGQWVEGKPSNEETIKANNILNNVKSVLMDDGRKVELIKTALELNPFALEPYYLLIDLCGDQESHIQTIGAVFGFSNQITQYKSACLKEIFDSRQKTTKNQLQELRQALLLNGKRLGVAEVSNVWLHEVEALLHTTDVNSRTVSAKGVEYIFSRQDTATKAKGFMKRIYEMILTEKRAKQLNEELDQLPYETDQRWNTFKIHMKEAITYILDVHTALGLNSYQLPNRYWDAHKNILQSCLAGNGGSVRSKAQTFLQEAAGFAPTYFAFAWSFAIDGDYHNALKFLNKAITFYPECAFYHYYMAHIYYKMGGNSDEWVEKSLELVSVCADSLKLKGYSHYQKGEYQVAMEYYNLAVAVNPIYTGDDTYEVMTRIKVKLALRLFSKLLIIVKKD